MRLDKERQGKLEPQRINIAIERIKKLGLEVIEINSTKIVFIYNGNKITFFPYSGWHSGKGIEDGRGIENLIRQIEHKEGNWIKLDSELDLPTETGIYWLRFESGSIEFLEMTTLIYRAYWFEHATHYQKILKPKFP